MTEPRILLSGEDHVRSAGLRIAPAAEISRAVEQARLATTTSWTAN